MNTRPHLIRRLRESDIPQAHALLEAVIPWSYKENGIGHYSEAMAAEIESKKRMLHQDIATKGDAYYFLIAEREGSIIGIIAHGPSNPLMDMCSKGASLGKRGVNNLLIARDHQRQGLGKELFYAIITLMKAAGIEDFCLDCGYQLAQPMWRKLLGEPQYKQPDYWGKGIDHLGWQMRIADVVVSS